MSTPQEHISVAEVLMQYSIKFLKEGDTVNADEMMELAIARKKMAEREEEKCITK